MNAAQPIRICFIAPTIYGVYNPQVRTPCTGGDLQIYELVKFLARNESFDIHLVTDDYGQQETEFYNGALLHRATLTSELPFWQKVLGRTNAFEELLKQINAHLYFMAGASGLTYRVAQFCRKHKRAFIFRIIHQRDCDGTFVHGNAHEGHLYKQALQLTHLILCQTHEQKKLLLRTERKNSLVIRNGIHLPFLQRENSRRDIIWAGEVLEWKQPEMFLRLALTFPNHSFTMFAMPRSMDYFERLVENEKYPQSGSPELGSLFRTVRVFDQAKLLVNTSATKAFPSA